MPNKFLDKFALGTWGLGGQWRNIEDQEVLSILRLAHAGGLKWVDTADCYGIPQGVVEERIGHSKRCGATNFKVITKVGNWGVRTGNAIRPVGHKDVKQFVHDSLRRLRSEYIDIVLCHEALISEPDEYIEAFEQLTSSGDIGEYGISSHSTYHISNFQTVAPRPVSVEIPYSIVDKELLNSISKSPLSFKRIIARSILGMGTLSGKYSLDHSFSDSVRQRWNKNAPRRRDFEERIERASLLGLRNQSEVFRCALVQPFSQSRLDLIVVGCTTEEQLRTNISLVLEAGKPQGH